ncbi:MAG: hypothetical protein JNJ63_02830 [Hyphomonadaceae bacterium]|nr:hypothetical protein [Hyphomonadaceae bacterium]
MAAVAVAIAAALGGAGQRAVAPRRADVTPVVVTLALQPDNAAITVSSGSLVVRIEF